MLVALACSAVALHSMTPVTASGADQASVRGDASATTGDDPGAPEDDGSAPSTAAEVLESLSWLAGSWTSPDGTVMESWTAPERHALRGLNVTVRNNRVAAHEVLSIEVVDDRVVYFASPSGRSPATPFTLVEWTEWSATFDNPAHDFPRRIRYERRGDQLTASIYRDPAATLPAGTWTWTRQPDARRPAE